MKERGSSDFREKYIFQSASGAGRNLAEIWQDLAGSDPRPEWL